MMQKQCQLLLWLASWVKILLFVILVQCADFGWAEIIFNILT